jgi:hypothetical protein
MEFLGDVEYVLVVRLVQILYCGLHCVFRHNKYILVKINVVPT